MCLYQDESIKIRKLAEDDLPSLHRLLSNEAVMRFLEAPFTEVQTQRFLQDAGLANPPLIYAVDNAAGDFVGYMIFHPYEGSFDELGWVLLPNFWGRGYAQRITGAAIQLAQKKRQKSADRMCPRASGKQAYRQKVWIRIQWACRGA